MGSAIRNAMGYSSLILVSGALLLMIFVVISGVTDHTPFNKTYFLRADTSGIEGARPVSQWTYFYVCGQGNQDCGSPVPALPFGYAWVGGGTGAPSSLLGSHGKGTTSTFYYYLWRFGWVFYLMGFATTALAFFTVFLAPCSRLASGLTGLILTFALFWYSLGAALMTAEFVKARNAFHKNNIDAKLGRWAFGFTWGAWAAMFLATLFTFLGCAAGRSSRDDKIRSSGGSTRGGMSNAGFFRRNRSKRSARGSFIESDSQRRVKEEYN